MQLPLQAIAVSTVIISLITYAFVRSINKRRMRAGKQPIRALIPLSASFLLSVAASALIVFSRRRHLDVSDAHEIEMEALPTAQVAPLLRKKSVDVDVDVDVDADMDMALMMEQIDRGQPPF